ncbi:13533_t:CDS:2 [Funneliformis geosporum]|uniref:13533_t:CDS:1 n=1 Tax=Funneliformis geosporum TaxID=1117311 RepID=A0A9W4SAZ1_9GLOM|nr:13533_t:CDS:2 [Funneliformis geosporum]
MVGKLGKRIKGVSLFAGAGIAETYLKEIGIDIVVANELIESRANFYQHLYPYSKMVIGDIKDEKVKEEIEKHISQDVKLLLVTPPCQGVSSLGTSKSLLEILNNKYSDKYNVEGDILNAKDYGVPQNAISHLPSLESGERSDIKWHYSRPHNPRDVIAMKHTPTGCSAFKNLKHYPKKEDSQKINGFHNTYKRMNWDEPAPARTMNSGNIGSHNNVHPGNLKPDGTYSDARTLTVHELLIVSSLPIN